MRHANKNKALGRRRNERRALIRGLVSSAIIYEKIRTTGAKARAARMILEKLITLAKSDTVEGRRKALRLLSRGAVKKLFAELGPRYRERKGGYTRILKMSARRSDSADIVKMELV